MARSLLEPRVISSNRPVLQLRVPAQFYLENKGKCILEAWGKVNQKDAKRREATSSILAPLFMFFSSPQACPM